jgi:predicted hotdog family 3-hydroxylacyl-ACP dehydratase
MDPQIPIQELIPQRPPFVLVDRFVFEDEETLYSLFRVPADHVMVEDGVLTEGGLVENIAQTAAARAGFLCRRDGLPVPRGYIGAVQQLEIRDLPAVADEIRTSVTIKHQVFNATQVQGTVWLGNKVLGTCDMKIFIV